MRPLHILNWNIGRVLHREPHAAEMLKVASPLAVSSRSPANLHAVATDLDRVLPVRRNPTDIDVCPLDTAKHEQLLARRRLGSLLSRLRRSPAMEKAQRATPPGCDRLVAPERRTVSARSYHLGQ
jgi:hypothetical protein